MLRLRAIEPDGLGVHDADGVGQDLRSGTGGSVGGHEAGEEGVRHVLHYVLDGSAGLVESRLDDGVVLCAQSEEISNGANTFWTNLGVELELDEVSNVRLDVLWREGEVVGADLDDVRGHISC